MGGEELKNANTSQDKAMCAGTRGVDSTVSASHRCARRQHALSRSRLDTRTAERIFRLIELWREERNFVSRRVQGAASPLQQVSCAGPVALPDRSCAREATGRGAVSPIPTPI